MEIKEEKVWIIKIFSTFNFFLNKNKRRFKNKKYKKFIKKEYSIFLKELKREEKTVKKEKEKDAKIERIKISFCLKGKIIKRVKKRRKIKR
jgi:hypothetical protein